MLQTTKESLEKTLEGMKDAQQLEKAITTGTSLVGYNLEAPRFVGR